MDQKVTEQELNNRFARFTQLMDKYQPSWKVVIITSKINQYYFTGTMQDGVVIIQRNEEMIYWVRRSFERACTESPLQNIKPMKSYRDIVADNKIVCHTLFLETNRATYATVERLQKSFGCQVVKSVDAIIAMTRSVKSDYELYWMKKSGEAHAKLLNQEVPKLLKDGMTELELSTKIYQKMIELGHQGVCRFSMQDVEMVVGQIGFGENSHYPCYFNGPGGMRGRSAAVPIVASDSRKLKEGDLVFVDIAFGMNGYHTDCTKTYLYKGQLSQTANEFHEACYKIQQRIVNQLQIGAIPSQVYQSIINDLEDNIKRNFMGMAGRNVPFLGHSIGLEVDEQPVIAKGFDMPIEENMVFAIEPKYAVEGVGTVGVEDTYWISKKGAVCLTKQSKAPINVE